MWTVSHLSGVEYPFFFPGTRYNIIEIPPQKSNCSDTLEGAKVLCSIAPMDKMKPSYYHSFGKNVSYAMDFAYCEAEGAVCCPLPLDSNFLPYLPNALMVLPLLPFQG